MKKLGFTLIELMIVVAMIAILAAMVTSALSASKKKSQTIQQPQSKTIYEQPPIPTPPPRPVAEKEQAPTRPTAENQKAATILVDALVNHSDEFSGVIVEKVVIFDPQEYWLYFGDGKWRKVSHNDYFHYSRGDRYPKEE